ARCHVVDQALTQRADGLLGHRKLLSCMGLNPMILRQGRAFSLSLPPRAPPAGRPYRASGLVHGRKAGVEATAGTVKGFGRRPFATVGPRPGPALESLPRRK